MKTKKIYLLGAVLVAALTSFAFHNHKSRNSYDISLDNVEALSRDENNLIQFCNDMCTDSPRDVCSHVTAIGIQIDCQDMKKKPE